MDRRSEEGLPDEEYGRSDFRAGHDRRCDDELADELREGPLALAVATVLQMMAAILKEGVTALYGPRSRHDLRGLLSVTDTRTTRSRSSGKFHSAVSCRFIERTESALAVGDRCRIHKIVNVEARLPMALAATMSKKMRVLYRFDDALRAKGSEARPAPAKEPPRGALGGLRRGSTRCAR